MSAVQQEGLLFPSMIDQKDFLRFALFDTFRIKKRWKTPVLFGVLLGIGLILPIVWYLLFLSSIRNEARKLGLSKVKAAYSLLLRDDGVTVMRENEKAEYAWKDIHMAWRVKGCIYLYVLPTRAFLMPKLDESDEAWEIICLHLPESKWKDLR